MPPSSKTRRTLVAYSLVAPFVLCFVVFFLYPAFLVVELSFQNAAMVGERTFVGFANYAKLLGDKLFYSALRNNAWFILYTVIPTTAIALGIALMVSRLSGWMQSFVLVIFFLPYVLPVSVVTEIWMWMLDFQFGILQPVIAFFTGKSVAVFKNPYWALPTVAVVTIWWTNGFNVLLFIAGLRNIPKELYESSALDGATSWQRFRRVTWPLLWPVTALVLTLQLILQLKLFDQVFLMTKGGPFNSSYVLLLLIYREGFQLNHVGYAAAISVVLVLVIAIASVFQFQLLRAGGRR